MYAGVWLFFAAAAAVFDFSTADDTTTDIWTHWVPLSEYNLFPTLPIAAPFSQDEKCREESRRLILSLKNKTLWAMQMWDSSATTTFGALHGNKYHFGNYDECLAVTKPVRAHYCEAKIRAYVHTKEAFEGDFHELNPDPNATVWRKFQNSRRDHTQYARDESQWGLCVPSSCNATEMEKAINEYLSELNEGFLKTNGTTYEVEIPDDYCYTGAEDEFTYGEIGFWAFTWLLLILIGIATSIDLGKTKELVIEEWKSTKLLMSFSIKRNLKRIMQSDDSPETNHLKFLHGIRCISIGLIVLDHHVAIFLPSAMYNRQTVEEALRSHQNLFVPHGDLLVDTFFYISGFLVTYMLLTTCQKKRFNLLFAILHRFLRLAPLYFYVVWFQASVLLRFGSGPAWKLGLKDEVEFCQKNWWANLLFIQNYVNPREMCMLHAWYLPCDLHFFIMAVFLIILIRKNKIIGSYVLHILTFIAILIPGIVTYIHELQPILAFNPKFVDKPRLDPSFEYLYVKTHTRAAVYLMGILTAYYLFERRNSEWKISKRISILTCFVGLGLLFAPMVYGSLYYNPKKKYNLAESVTFAILRRFSWGLGWVLFMVVNRFGVIPIFGKVFTWKISVPLSKTTYAIYLIHFIIQMADEAKAKIPYQFISFEMFVKGTNDLFFSTGYALVLYLIIELPFRLIFKELLFPTPKKKPAPLPELNNLSAKSDVPQVFSIKL